MANNKDFKVKNGIQPTVYHEAVGTVTSGSTSSILGASYEAKSFSVNSQDISLNNFYFKSDGTKFFYIGNNTDTVYQYSMSTAWDISTASYDSKSFSVQTQDTNPRGLSFSTDGTKMYISGAAGDDINYYTLSTAWDVSTASFNNATSVASEATNPYALAFKSDGTKMYIFNRTSPYAVYQYSLSTAWDTSTLSYDSVSINVSGESSAAFNMTFKYDGTSFYITDVTDTKVYEYTLTTAWDLSTAAYSNKSVDLSSENTSLRYFSVHNSGNTAYSADFTGNTLYQYSTSLTTKTLDLSTGSVFEITPTSNIQIGLSNPAASGTVSAATLLLDGGNSSEYDIANATLSNTFSVSSQDVNPQGFYIKPDGTSFYVAASGTDSIYQYNMTTPWDTSTASYASKTLSVSGQDTDPTGIHFKPDGTNMYITGTSSDSVYEYSLSTAWDLSTASVTSNTLSLVHDETTTNPHGIRFKPDGTKLFAVVQSDDTVDEWTMATPWDIANATYSQSFSVQTQEHTPNGLDFNEDGTLMFITGQNSDYVYKYTLSTEWDVSTASYSNQSVYISAEETIPEDIQFGDYGRRMYIIGSNGDEVNEYSVGAEATITYDSSLEFAGGTAPTSPEKGETDVLTFMTVNGGTSYVGALNIDGAK